MDGKRSAARTEVNADRPTSHPRHQGPLHAWIVSRRRDHRACCRSQELTAFALPHSQSNLELVSTRREGDDKKGETVAAASKEELAGTKHESKDEPQDAAATAKSIPKADAASQKEEGA